MNVAYARLHNQRLSSAQFTKAGRRRQLARRGSGAGYPGARWALALRMRRATDAAIERAFAAGEILRTHVLRPTWHFVAPADIRWMLALTAPRVRSPPPLTTAGSASTQPSSSAATKPSPAR